MRVATSALGLTVLLVLLTLLAPVTAASSGSLAPPYTDSGVDTNGDRLYNFLRINVTLSIAIPGTFTVKVLLKDDLDLGTLTQSSVTAGFAAGLQTVSVLLDGPDIYNGGVNGPYYAHVTLLSEYGEVLGTASHVTAAYAFTDFQPYAAHFVLPRSERTVDNDSDGLANWIDLGFTIDVATAGSYTLASLLTDTQYMVAVRWTQTQNLVPGKVSLHQLFLGYPLRLTQRNGPYMVTNRLTDSHGAAIDFLFLTTNAYNYTDFEGSPLRFVPPHSDKAVDSDGDGFYDTLRVNVNLTAETAGTYNVRGQLYGGTGTLITATAYLADLGSGPSTVPLSFSGAAIRASGLNGPYLVRLQAYDTSVLLLSVDNDTTAYYLSSEFQPPALVLDPPHEDRGVDIDGNGKFDVLRLSVHLNVTRATSVRLGASLRKGVLAADILHVEAVAYVAPGSQVVDLDFPGPGIASAGVDGPYWTVISANGPNGSLWDEGNYRTQGYLATDFDSSATLASLAVTKDRGEDVDGNGLLNRLRVELLANVTTAGRFRVDGRLSRDGVPVADASCTMSLLPGSNPMALLFGGQDIRSAGRDGPYSLRLVLVALPAEVVATSLNSVTSAYAVASFERADPINLSGQVVSSSTGVGLPGASVWLVDYVNYTSRRVTADPQGAFALSAFKGSYAIVVDHPDANAKLIRKVLLANTSLTVGLSPIARDTVRDTLTWAGWDQLLIDVRQTRATDGMAYRIEQDWWAGNRDGWLSPSESSDWPDPTDPFLIMIETGSSGASLPVNGRTFVADAPAEFTDLMSGDVFGTSLPMVEASRMFHADLWIGLPQRVELLLPIRYDSLMMDRALRLFAPTKYLYMSSAWADNVSVRARKYTLPMYVDPDMGSNLTEPPSVATMQMVFYLKPIYVPSTPSAPSGLVASVSGPAVCLAWQRPATNLDGSPLKDLAGYRVYRSSSESGPFELASDALVGSEGYTDYPGVGAFYYGVSSVTTDGTEGPMSNTISSQIQAAQLRVSVVDAGGQPVRDAHVALLVDGGASFAESVTDAGGRAAFLIPPGPYTIHIDADGVVAASLNLELGAGRVSVTISVVRTSPGDGPPTGLPAGVLVSIAALVVGGVLVTAAVSRRQEARIRAGLPCRPPPP